MGDNGAMIAYLGLLMYKSGYRTTIAESKVNPNFRPDEEKVRWIPKEFDMFRDEEIKDQGKIASGAEAVITLEGNTITKTRVSKSYRIKEIDDAIRRERTRSEARLISEARRCGVPTPIIRDASDFDIKMEYIEGNALKKIITPDLAEKTGELIGGFIQGE